MATMSGYRVFLELSKETRDGLDRLYDEDDGVEPSKRVHRYMREWAFKSPMPNVPGVSTLNAQVSAAIQRGEARIGNRTISAEEIRTNSSRFTIPDGHSPDEPVPDGCVDVVFAGKLMDVIPLCLSFTDLMTSAEIKRNRDWNDFPSFARLLVIGMVAQDLDVLDAKEVQREEDELFKPAKRKDQKKAG